MANMAPKAWFDVLAAPKPTERDKCKGRESVGNNRGRQIDTQLILMILIKVKRSKAHN